MFQVRLERVIALSRLCRRATCNSDSRMMIVGKVVSWTDLDWCINWQLDYLQGKRHSLSPPRARPVTTWMDPLSNCIP